MIEREDIMCQDKKMLRLVRICVSIQPGNIATTVTFPCA